jgi:hypothetical protein
VITEQLSPVRSTDVRIDAQNTAMSACFRYLTQISSNFTNTTTCLWRFDQFHPKLGVETGALVPGSAMWQSAVVLTYDACVARSVLLGLLWKKKETSGVLQHGNHV